eukprot:CAMPEP_0206034266 /NCGR_PEP_ID=MMETSP1466-20131121/1232_1 /ASSEMBLY_ACC=CAM_ASM_001126 /TAXON_ID=44452 /ORGANISM="Pavlova gyrans, Strain CCMP608" /LENGTH=42 /DNA_ID= /DNA_START= /DNA_END= /DNA_ORIENTATION=
MAATYVYSTRELLARARATAETFISENGGTMGLYSIMGQLGI